MQNKSILYQKTPLLRSHEISRLNSDETINRNIYLKMDCLQPTGSFKLRGISNLILKSQKDKNIESIISSSGGNAGFAAAYVGEYLNIKTTIVTPTSTSKNVIEELKKFGANVIVHGDAWDESNKKALDLTNNNLDKTLYVPPFDHPLIWDGNSTIIDESKEEMDNLIPDCIIASVGGGGLACGLIEGMLKHDWINKGVKLILVETEGADCFNKSVKADKIVTLEEITSIAKTLGAKRCAEQLFNYYKCYQSNIDSIVVNDKQAVEAVSKFLDDHRILVEPSCGASLAVAYNMNKYYVNEFKNVLVIVCGGSSINLETLLNYKKLFN